MQTTLVIIFVTLSVAYAVWRIQRVLQASSDPCASCQGCALKKMRRKNGENKHCTEKKSKKNLAI